MKIVTILGARPQFVKAAAVSPILKQIAIDEVIVHTGQHYDKNMSDVFFQELPIPTPAYNLGVGGGMHGKMTASMLIGIEKLLVEEKPQAVLVYGDTNSTLAGSLAASKLHIPLLHIEAGLRSFNKRMPEEINRIVTDRLSDLLLCPSQTAVDNLKNEGITENVEIVGDVMGDICLLALTKVHEQSVFKWRRLLGVEEYVLMTCHRAENTDNADTLRNIFAGTEAARVNIVFPVHPRTRKFIEDNNIAIPDNVICIEPVGYLDMIALIHGSKFVLTDSGGVQKEAYWARKHCITLRNETEWIETVSLGWNSVVGADPAAIKKACLHNSIPESHPDIYGNGKAGELTAKSIQAKLREFDK